jgi:hypothetical protein
MTVFQKEKPRRVLKEANLEAMKTWERKGNSVPEWASYKAKNGGELL